MEWLISLIIMAPMAALFTGIGIFAMRREKPMWFYSGTTVREEEITDVRAYNKANGIMWIVFSIPFWICVLVGCIWPKKAWIPLVIACFLGIPVLVFSWHRIYNKYKAKK